MPTRWSDPEGWVFKSSLVCTYNVLLHSRLQISYSFCVLELLLSPITIIISTSEAIFCASSCLWAVALQIVFTTSTLYPFFRKISTNSLNLARVNVVWETTVIPHPLSAEKSLASSFVSITTAGFPGAHHPIIPITSG